MHLALFGDLDVSTIREKPANRKGVITKFVDDFNRNKAYDFVKKEIIKGRQAFVICPLIEEKNNSSSDDYFELEKKTVIGEYANLKTIFPEAKISYLHGKMKPKEKDEIMAQFSLGETDILVSTSVVEVGVDIPNASVMIIESADRFGLAQLHQFRGRVGRGEHQSFCFLFSETQNEKTKERLLGLEKISDGFALAELDLKLRGPGSIFGTDQSGLFDFKFASFTDQNLINFAIDSAKTIIGQDSELKNYPKLRQKITDYAENNHME